MRRCWWCLLVVRLGGLLGERCGFLLSSVEVICVIVRKVEDWCELWVISQLETFTLVDWFYISTVLLY